MAQKHKLADIKGSKNTANLTVSLYEGDHEMVEFMVRYFKTSRSDVVRTAIRTQVSLLMQFEKQKGSIE